MPEKIKDLFYDNITIEYLLKGDGYGNIYTADIMRFFGIDIKKANEIKPKIEELVRRLNEAKN